MDTTLGTCSVCGGRVTVPEAWYSTKPPIPRCESCGATVKQPYGPILQTENPTRKAQERG